MFSVNNSAGQEMDGGTASSGDWRNWCRLCAKEDELNRNIYLKDDFVHNEEDMTAERLISVINEYFSVEIQMLDTLPQNLCLDCLSFLRTLMSFQRRVLKVQQMYAELKNLSEAKNIKTQALRLKFQLMDAAGTEESMVAAMIIKKEEENVAPADEGVCDFQSDEAMVINHVEEKEVKPTDGVYDIQREEAMIIKQEEEDEVATAGEIVCEFQSAEAAEPYGTASEDNLYRNAKDYSDADISEAETTAKQAEAAYKYFCMKCPRRFQYKSDYSTHLLTHALYAPFECEVCKKRFKSQERLKNHMSTHSVENYICRECGLKLGTKSALNRHMILHSDIMKYVCDYCGRTFKHRNSYTTHLMIHCGFKPHSCEFCDMAFTSASHCRSHMYYNHPSEFAEMQASGKWKPTKNIPTLDVLKAIISKGENLVPVLAKGAKKPNTQTVAADCAQESENLAEAKNIKTQALRLKGQLRDVEESMVATMVIKTEEENVATADESVCDFQSDEATFLNHEEEKEVATTDGVYDIQRERGEAMLIKQEEEDEVSTADESVCDHKSEEAMDIKQEEEEEIATADESMCDFQSEEAADCENKPCGTASEDEGEYRDAKEDYSDADISEPEATAKQAAAEYKYFCMKCPQRFQFKSSYSTHLSIKHGIMVKPTYSCSTCQRNFKDCYSLTRHMKSHHPEKVCPIEFVHENTRLLKCEVCGAAIRTQRTFRRHMLTHTDYAPFECEVCKKCFKSEERLKNHMSTHSAEKQTCSECGVELSSKINLNRHMVVHSDVMKYGCDYCEKTFKYSTSYRTHLMTHCGLKPYSCVFCDKTFASASNRRSHMTRNHPSELAEMQTSGEWKPTKNIPTIDVLKAMLSKGENILPVISKGGKKPKTQMVVADRAQKSDQPQETAVVEESKEFIKI